MLVLSACGRDSPADVEIDAFDELRADVQRIVADPARAQQAVRLVDALQQEFNRVKTTKLERQQRFQALNADYDATPAAFDALLADIDNDVEDNQQRLSNIMQDFLRVTTPEEWAKFEDTREDAMLAAMAALQAI